MASGFLNSHCLKIELGSYLQPGQVAKVTNGGDPIATLGRK